MINRLAGFIAVLRREAIILSKDINLISIILLAPLFYASFYTSIYVNKSESKVPVAVMDMDRSVYSEEFIRKLDAHKIIQVNEILTDMNSIKDRIYQDDEQSVIIIPKDFESNIKSNRSVTIKIYLNTVRFLVSNDLNKAINEVVQNYHKDIKMKILEMNGYSIDQAKGMYDPLRVDLRNLFNPSEAYGDFIIPGILILILQATLLIGLSESMAREREKNLLGELLYTANRSNSAALLGKASFYMFFYMGYSIFYFTVIFSFFKINFAGSFFLLMLFTVIFFISIITSGIFISSFFKKKIIALQVIAFTTYPLFFISGYIWPIQSMPAALQNISYLIPLVPYFKAFLGITQMGASFSDLIPPFIHLCILAALGTILTYARIHFLLKKEAINPGTYIPE
ncbi:MAG: ABC transporter permease [Ignavibacteriaceae bacterium]